MKTYSVTLEEITEHVVEVEANSESEACEEAVRGWKEGYYVDGEPWLCKLTAVGTSEH